MHCNMLAIFAIIAVAAASPLPKSNGLFPGDTTTDITTNVQANKKCSPNQVLACCNEATQSCSPLALLQLLPIGQACGNANNVQCCDNDQFGLLNLNILNCNRILS